MLSVDITAARVGAGRVNDQTHQHAGHGVSKTLPKGITSTIVTVVDRCEF